LIVVIDFVVVDVLGILYANSYSNVQHSSFPTECMGSDVRGHY
jgi:hypothetical protein